MASGAQDGGREMEKYLITLQYLQACHGVGGGAVGSGGGLPRLRKQGGLPRGGNAELSPQNLRRFCWGRREESVFPKEEQMDKTWRLGSQ